MDIDWKMAVEAPMEALVNSLSMALPFSAPEKQALLEAVTLKNRAETLTLLLKIGRFTRRRLRLTHASIRPQMTNPPGVTDVDPRLLEVLVCPVTRGALDYDREKQELISRKAKLAYPIRDGVPIMLAEEARALDEAE